MLSSPLFGGTEETGVEGAKISIYLEKVVSFQWGRPIASSRWRAFHENLLETTFLLTFGDCFGFVTGDVFGSSQLAPEAKWGVVSRKGGSCTAIRHQQWDKDACWLPNVKCTILNYSPPQSLLLGVRDVSTKRLLVYHCIQQARMQNWPHGTYMWPSWESLQRTHSSAPWEKTPKLYRKCTSETKLFFLMFFSAWCAFLQWISWRSRARAWWEDLKLDWFEGGQTNSVGWEIGILRLFWTGHFTAWG